MMIPRQIPTNTGFPWVQRGATWIFVHPQHWNFRLLKSMFYFPLFVLKGIYHYWKYFIFFSTWLQVTEATSLAEEPSLLRASWSHCAIPGAREGGRAMWRGGRFGPGAKNQPPPKDRWFQSLFPFARASHFGDLFLTHTHVVFVGETTLLAVSQVGLLRIVGE